jgi:hypothetical protein
MGHRPHEQDIGANAHEPSEDFKNTSDRVTIEVWLDPSEDVGDSGHKRTRA